jgi:hypothetical protein
MIFEAHQRHHLGSNGIEAQDILCPRPWLPTLYLRIYGFETNDYAPACTFRFLRQQSRVPTKLNERLQ